jgi:hypothetical protein
MQQVSCGVMPGGGNSDLRIDSKLYGLTNRDVATTDSPSMHN